MSDDLRRDGSSADAEVGYVSAKLPKCRVSAAETEFVK
jgi:hypothetical protein